jgi:hypothetical protein
MGFILGGIALLAAGLLAATMTGTAPAAAPPPPPEPNPKRRAPAKAKSPSAKGVPVATTQAMNDALAQAQSLNTFDAWNMVFGLATKAGEDQLANYARQRMQALDTAQGQAQAQAQLAHGLDGVGYHPAMTETRTITLGEAQEQLRNAVNQAVAAGEINWQRMDPHGIALDALSEILTHAPVTREVWSQARSFLGHNEGLALVIDYQGRVLDVLNRYYNLFVSAMEGVGGSGNEWIDNLAVRAITEAKSCPCPGHWLIAARACLTAGHMRGHGVARAQYLALGGDPAMFGPITGEVGRGSLVWVIFRGRAYHLPAGGVPHYLSRHPEAHRATRADYIKVQRPDGSIISMLRVLASKYVHTHPGARIVRDRASQNLQLPPTAPDPNQDPGPQDDGSQDDGSQDPGSPDDGSGSPDQG